MRNLLRHSLHLVLLVLGAFGQGDVIEIVDVDEVETLDALRALPEVFEEGLEEPDPQAPAKGGPPGPPRPPSSTQLPFNGTNSTQQPPSSATQPPPSSAIPSTAQPNPPTVHSQTTSQAPPLTAVPPSPPTDAPRSHSSMGPSPTHYTPTPQPSCPSPQTCRDGKCNYVINIPTGGGGCDAVEALVKQESSQITALTNQVSSLSTEVQQLKTIIQNFVNQASPCFQNCANKTTGYLQIQLQDTEIRIAAFRWSYPTSYPCASFPCLNGGSCFAETYGPHCECPQPFYGAHCESHVTPKPTPGPCQGFQCQNNGTCVLVNGQPTCQCPAPYEGPTCGSVNHCDPLLDPCAHGNCTNTPTGASCTCKPLFTGQHCDEPICAPGGFNPCLHNGTCTLVQSPAGLAPNCTCAHGWTGPRCAQDVNECLSSPCGCNSTCHNTPGSYFCACQKGFTGPLCCTDIDECVHSPCLHGATCVNTRGSYNCLCPDDAVGKNCSKVLHCLPDTCGRNAKCYVGTHVLRCACEPGFSGDPYSRQGCSLSTRQTCAYGDPHFVTFDKLHYDYQGTCPVQLSKPCKPSQLSSIPDFSAVLVDAPQFHNSRVSYAKTLELSVYGKKITLGRRSKVAADGLDVFLPWYYPNRTSPKVWVKPWGFNGAVLHTDFHLRATFAADWSVCLTVPNVPELEGKLCGLGGNMNGHNNDDIRLRNGTVLHNTRRDLDAFGDSWITRDDGKCFHGKDMTPTTCPNPTVQRAARQNCSVLTDANGPFAQCQGLDFVSDAEKNCKYDQCAFYGAFAPAVLCNDLSNFAQRCQAAFPGLPIAWRSAQLCPLQCGTNEEYSACAEACPGTCPDPSSPLTCTTACHEGCQCKAGFVLDSGRCIRPSDCGCSSSDGTYHPANSTWTNGDCSLLHTCTNGVVVAQNMTCVQNAKCDVQGGVLGCHCDQGYQGDGMRKCSDIDECLNSTICGHGNCTNTPGNFQCHCAPNWTGKQCSQHVNYCENMVCDNGGTCVDTGYAFHCVCQGGYYGLYCQSTPQRHCADLQQYHHIGISGNYPVRLPSGAVIYVFCDMESQGGGWTLFLKRTHGSLDFGRNWANYSEGFGVLYDEFWMGLNYLHTLTSQGQTMSLRADLTFCGEQPVWAEYQSFGVGGAGSNYSLSVSATATGPAGNGLASAGPTDQNGAAFQTTDHGGACPATLDGGFWFNDCGAANPTGRYYGCKGAASAPPYPSDGMFWTAYRGDKRPAAAVELKFRPQGYVPVHAKP